MLSRCWTLRSAMDAGQPCTTRNGCYSLPPAGLTALPETRLGQIGQKTRLLCSCQRISTPPPSLVEIEDQCGDSG